MNVCVCLIQFLLLINFICGRYAQDVGDPCINSDGSSGICKIMPRCPFGQEQLRKSHNHNLKRCGWVRNDEVVCCPEKNSSSNENSSGEEDSSTKETTTRKPMVKPTKPTKPSVDGSRNRNIRKCEVACDAFSDDAPSPISWHIINGDNAQEGEFPHMGALGYVISDFGKETTEWNCGASLISRNFLITAAHCVETQGVKPTVVRMGLLDLLEENSTKKQDYTIKEIIVHDDYDISEKYHDLALIQIEENVKFTNSVFPACLYTKNDEPGNLIITGWGVINSNQENSVNALQRAEVQPAKMSECRKQYRDRVHKNITDYHICALDSRKSKPSDACQGDSGGPLQVQNVKDTYMFSIVGIVSYGQGCGSKFPSVYTRVSKYLDWIEQHVWP